LSGISALTSRSRWQAVPFGAVEDRGVIKVDMGPQPSRRWLAPFVVVALLVGVLVSLGAYRGSDATVSREELPDLGPGPAESARLVVGEFAVAWNRGDVDTVESLIADEWESIALPGFLDSRFTPMDGRQDLRDGIRFLTSVAQVSLGACNAAVAPPDSSATAVVRCDEAEFHGDYLDALGQDFRLREEPGAVRSQPAPGITVAVRNSHIVSIDTDAQSFFPQAYCLWVEQARPDLAASLFDLYCYPATTPANGEAHAELAGSFVNAGSPLPSARLVEARLVASFVDRFVTDHNLNHPFTVLRWLSPELSPTDLPGYTGSDEPPRMVDYLLWSTQLIDIETGDCPVSHDDGFTIVTCADLTLSGVLFDEPTEQPTRFVLVDSMTREVWGQPFDRILAVERLSQTPPPVEEACRRLRRSDPITAAATFTADCVPIYTQEAADILATALEEL
jgi:hypothetical protein